MCDEIEQQYKMDDTRGQREKHQYQPKRIIVLDLVMKQRNDTNRYDRHCKARPHDFEGQTRFMHFGRVWTMAL